MASGYPLQNTLPVSALGVDSRATFINRTYQHLLGAIVGFAAIEVFLFTSGIAEKMALTMLSVGWLWILGAFMIVGWLASRTALQSESLGAQYAALVGFVVAEAIIFVPMLYYANEFSKTSDGGNMIQSAALVTLLGFAGLTAVAFVSRKDFSFLGSLLRWAFVVALVLIVGGAIFGFQLGTFFSVAMIGLAGASILYDTSNVLHHFPEDRYVGASLQLFASVAMMFWYVLRLFMSRD